VEGLLLTLALFVALGIGLGLIPRSRRRWRGPEQTSEPPGDRSAPDDWPRDGGDNPRAP
jgi:hypothetical protein